MRSPIESELKFVAVKVMFTTNNTTSRTPSRATALTNTCLTLLRKLHSTNAIPASELAHCVRQNPTTMETEKISEETVSIIRTLRLFSQSSIATAQGRRSMGIKSIRRGTSHWDWKVLGYKKYRTSSVSAVTAPASITASNTLRPCLVFRTSNPAM